MKQIFIIIAILFLAIPCLAANQYLYVRDCDGDSSCGTGAGTSWTNPYDTIAAAEAAVDRSSYDAVYIYVADGNYGTCTFDAAVSGTKWVYVKKATVAEHGTDTGWDNGYGDGQAVFTVTSGSTLWTVSTSYWEFNGASRATDTAGYGFKLTTTTPTAVLFRPMQPSSTTNAPTNIRLLYSELEQMGREYNNWTTNMSNYPPIYFYFYLTGSGVTDGGNHYIGYNYIHDSPITLLALTRVGPFTIEYNYFEYSAAYNDDVPVPSSANCTASETPWPCCTGEGTGTCSATNQGSGMVTYCAQDSIIRNNTFKDVEGSCGICLYGWHGDTGVCPSQVNNVSVYNNLFYWSAYRPSNYALQNGVVTGDGGSTLTNIKVYNNTFANMSYSGSTIMKGPVWTDLGTSGNEFKNNVVYKLDSTNMAGNAFKGFTKTYNWYYGNTNAKTSSVDSDWASGETGAVVGTGSPFTNDVSDFTLAVGSTPIDSGTTIATYNIDRVGTARPQGSAYDMGAYEYTSGSAPDTTAPTITSATVDTSGTLLSIVFSETVVANINTGFTLTMSGGEGVLSYASGSNSNTLVYNITGRTIDDDETGVAGLDYVQPGSGIEDLSGNDLASTGETDINVTNNSTYSPSETTYVVTPTVYSGCSISPDSATIVPTGTTTQFTCTAGSNHTCVAWTETGAGCGTGSGTTTFTTGTITGDCAISQSCPKTAADSLIGEGAAMKVGSGAAMKIY